LSVVASQSLDSHSPSIHISDSVVSPLTLDLSWQCGAPCRWKIAISAQLYYYEISLPGIRLHVQDSPQFKFQSLPTAGYEQGISYIGAESAR
jgi:hypothetical protein